MITPVDIVQIPKLVDFQSGPFSDNRIYSKSARRLVCERLLRQMLRHPKENAADIILVNEKLKALG